MVLPKVAIDLKTMIDPYKMFHIVEGLDKTYSEILIADQLQLLEIGLVGDLTLGLDILGEPTFPNGHFWEEIFGCKNDDIQPQNFMLALKMLRIAYNEGAVSVYDSIKYSEIGNQIIKLNEPIIPYYIEKSPIGMNVRILPDWGYDALSSIVGVEAVFGATPYISDESFYELISQNKPSGTILGTNGVIELEEYKQYDFRIPKFDDLDEFYKYARQHKTESNNVIGIIDRFKRDNSTIKEISINTIKFVGPMIIDAAFGGIPVASSTVFIYDSAKKILSVK
ncbi:hypothetical protein [Gudongella oleilytica]|uniref:hypothetical protein n=1 Tax=Gudongella oleilytica TaxID=1582259 RepID=UPI002A366103|nr:hypothetical protein [Gudongella oleilytica]MDY0257300.1 hypothetical protein [Gudongella oleilytica]